MGARQATGSDFCGELEAFWLSRANFCYATLGHRREHQSGIDWKHRSTVVLYCAIGIHSVICCCKALDSCPAKVSSRRTSWQLSKSAGERGAPSMEEACRYLNVSHNIVLRLIRDEKISPLQQRFRWRMRALITALFLKNIVFAPSGMPCRLVGQESLLPPNAQHPTPICYFLQDQGRSTKITDKKVRLLSNSLNFYSPRCRGSQINSWSIVILKRGE